MYQDHSSGGPLFFLLPSIALIGATFGTLMGFLAAHFRGIVEDVIMVFVDFQASMLLVRRDEALSDSRKDGDEPEAVGNILDNAVRFDHRRIGDDGPDTEPDNYPSILKRGVSGFGLAISDDIVTGHGSQLSLARSRLGGLEVLPILPASGPCDIVCLGNIPGARTFWTAEGIGPADDRIDTHPRSTIMRCLPFCNGICGL